LPKQGFCPLALQLAWLLLEEGTTRQFQNEALPPSLTLALAVLLFSRKCAIISFFAEQYGSANL
jgi:hypothetical protein